ncbi:hypothetical protein GFB56_05500 [Ensifer sp. T173]|uniref:ArsR family transcriptional regulator n=1 Tax=Ensifer canadensis TaxID=555315 RepID=A0AAW4FHE0_9HYPH|nr:hypothetical protein [Ensifer canadensis]MBM3090268.1 hypothetical protein [Ensifer canadensis]UBI75802.1 hypothetical protein J3R84_01175 [Ensifer canadensis]
MITNEEENYRRIRKSHQAFEILHTLAAFEPSGRSNDCILAGYLDLLALGGSRLEIRTALERLDQMGLLRSSAVDDYMVVTLTEKGERVARGSDQIEGVAKPPRD